MMALELPKKQGIYKQVLEIEGAATLRYTLSLPATVESGEALPLVVALHFGGTVTPYYGGGFLQVLVQPALESLGAIIIAPDCPAGGWDNPISETAVLTLMAHIKKHYNIAGKKVAITGFSLGGIGTWYIASRHPELFCAAIPVSGMPTQGVEEKARVVPFYVIHSNSDEIFPIDALLKVVKQVREQGVEMELEVLDGISHYSTDRFVPALRQTIPWLKGIWKR